VIGYSSWFSSSNVGFSQLLLKVWPSIGLLQLFQATSHRTRTRMRHGIVSSTCRLFQRIPVIQLTSLRSGGTSTLPQAMFKSLSASAQASTLFESPVTAISEAPNNLMSISINGLPSSQLYSAVISTVPLPRLSLMDLTGVGIAGAGSSANYAQWSAIRELQYGPAVKVGIRFNTPWWETNLPKPIHGGQSYTDLPLRTM